MEDPNGYETPNSFHVKGLSGPILYKPQSTAIIIPDSPRRRARRTLKSNGLDIDTSDSEIHAPRAESPELTSTPPHYLCQLADATPSSGQRKGERPDPDAHIRLALQVSMPLPESFSKHEDQPANLGDCDMVLDGGVLPEPIPPSLPRIVPRPPHIAPLPSTHSNSNLRESGGSSFLPSTLDDSFDPNNTDRENSRSSWLSNFKRLKKKIKRLPSPQVVSTRPQNSASAGERLVNLRSSGLEAESPISSGSATSTKGNSQHLQNLPQADSLQSEEPVTVSEEAAKPISPEKKAELQVSSDFGGGITYEPPQPHVPSGSITQEPPQPSPEEPVIVHKATVRPISSEKKAESPVLSESGKIVTKELPQPSPGVGPSRAQIPVTMIKETSMLKSSGKEAGAPSASTSSRSVKRKRPQSLPRAHPPRSQEVKSSAEAAVKSNPLDTKLRSTTPLSRTVNRSQLQPSSQASSARTENSMPVAESVVQPKASKEMQVVASAESSKDKESKFEADGATRITKKPNGAAAGEQKLADREAEKSVIKFTNNQKFAKDDEESNLEAVMQPEEKLKDAGIADTRPEPNTLDKNPSVKEHNLVDLTTDSLPKSSLSRSKISRSTLNSAGDRSQDSSNKTRRRNGPGPPPSDLRENSFARRKESYRTQKSSKPVVLNDGTDQSPQDEPRRTAVNFTTKAVNTLTRTVDTRILSEPSSPRGPAQYMSRPHSAESLTSVSSSGSDSDSQDDLIFVSQAVTPAKKKTEGLESLGNDVANSRVLANIQGSIGKGPVSKIAHSAISVSSRNSDSSESSGSESDAEEPESHLPKPKRDLDSSILVPNTQPRERKPTSIAPLPRRLDYSATSRSILDEKSTSVPSKANLKGERPTSSSALGGSRPSNSRYPSMTDLIKKTRPTEQSRPGNIVPPKSAATARGTSAFPFHSFSDSSSSETSSSEDDD